MSDTPAPRWFVTMWWHADLPDEPAWTPPITIWLTAARIEAPGDVSATPTREIAMTGIGPAISGASATLV
jgi:hypothetical protein